MLKYAIIFFISLIALQSFAQYIDYDTVKNSVIVSGRKNSDWAQQQPYVVLISIDGFRHDYAQKFGAVNIQRFSEKGVTTSRMIPVFPSKTFPNHYSLVTGVYPSTHGIVSNEFYSRSNKQLYRVSNPITKNNGRWYGGMPLWTLAENAGMLSASFFWVGSDATNEINTNPSYYYSYDGSIPNDYRFRQVIDWLEMDEINRPHFITTYFSLVDDAGHRYGPDAEQTKDAVLEIDSLFGDFMKALGQLNLPVQVIVVSDHGMSEINQGIVLSELVDLSDCTVSKSMPYMVYSDDTAKVNRIYGALKNDARIKVYRKSEIPDYLHYENADRIGDIIFYTDAPIIFLDKSEEVSGGTHGFDPYQNKDMGAFFGAGGSAFQSGKQIEPFENINIYPLIAHLLNLNISHKIDGDLKYLKPLIAEPTLKK